MFKVIASLRGWAVSALLAAFSSLTFANTYSVTTTADSGAGSFRQAILDANAHAGLDTVQFNIPGLGVQTISLVTTVTATDSVLIDGTTQPGYSGKPLIELLGPGSASTVDGITLNANSCTIQALAIGNFRSGIVTQFNRLNDAFYKNFVGIRADGITVAKNGTGLSVGSGSSGFVIGTPGQGNVFSGNGNGLFMSNLHSNLTVQGNKFGTDSTGMVAVPNTTGMNFQAPGSTVGGSGVGEGNQFAANSTTGISLAGNGPYFVLGNTFGLDATGNGVIPGTSVQIDVGGGSGTVIGSPTCGNIFAAGTEAIVGHSILTGSLTIQNNVIGFTKSGSSAPLAIGILLQSCKNIAIGGLNPNEGNVIGNCNNQAVVADSASSVITVNGNFIGTNAAGTAAAANLQGGVFIPSTSATVIGNVISGNKVYGVQLSMTSSSVGNAIVKNNKIGTDVTGTVALPNDIGLWLSNGNNNQIGGPNAGDGNIISGNNSFGLRILNNGGSDPANTLVQGNKIGVDAFGAPLGNKAAGIFITNGTGHHITQNSIAFNTGAVALGIDINPSGSNANDTGDPDTGANNKQNFPVLTAASIAASTVQITGTLNSAANGTYTIEFFANTSADPTNFGEGEVYVGTTTVTTDASGNASFNVTFSGSYSAKPIFSSTATDANGSTSEFSRDVTGVVANQAPTANAGTDQTVTVAHDHDPNTNSASVTLDGSASNDPENDSLTYAWSEGANSVGSGAQVTVNVASGTHTFTLTVTDSHGASSTDDVTVVVNPEPNADPVAQAGSDQSVTVAHDGNPATNTASFTIDGSTSSDPDSDSLTYAWKESGLTIGSTASLNLSRPAGTYTFTLTVTDPYGKTNADDVVVVVLPEPNSPPVANAGIDQTIAVPHDGDPNTNTTPIALDASGSSDPDNDVMTYSWSLNGVEVGTTSQLTVSKTAGTYTFTVTVTDSLGASSADTVLIKVNPEPNHTPNLPPSPGALQTVPHDGNPATNTVTITLGPPSVAGQDADGDPLIFRWKDGNGNIIATTQQLTVTLTPGTYHYTFGWSDPYGPFIDSASGIVTINPEPNRTPGKPPQITNTQTIPHDGNPATNTITVTLGPSSTAGIDVDGDPISFRWKDQNGNIIATTQQLTVTLTPGAYHYELDWSDPYGPFVNGDLGTVTINPEPNTAPSITLATTKTLAVPHDGDPATNTVPSNITATVGDSNGDVVTSVWTDSSSQVVGSGNTLNIPLTAGTYTFTLTATDTYGASSNKSIVVTVTAEPNNPPTVSLAASKALIIPHDGNPATNSVLSAIPATVTDPNGDTLTSVWTDGNNQIVGTGNTLNIPLVAGSYNFTITATDAYGASNSKSIAVTVTAETNSVPTVTLVPTKTLAIPHDGNPATNTINSNITASISDGNNDPLSISWTDDANQVVGTSSSLNVPLAAGTYTFTLTVSDPYGPPIIKSIAVTVTPEPNSPPFAPSSISNVASVAVPHDGNPTTNTVFIQFSGDGSDPENDNVTITWKDENGNVVGNTPGVAVLLPVGTHTITEIVTDPYGASTPGNPITVTVEPEPNVAPVAVASGDQLLTGNPSATFNLDASGSHDAEFDSLQYSWSDGTSVVGTSASITLSQTVGTYHYTVTVTDSYGAASTAAVTITIQPSNHAPNAVVGPNVSTEVPHDGNPSTNTKVVTLDGSGSNDPDAGQSLTYEWKDSNGNVVGTTPQVTVMLTPGTYIYTLTVADPYHETSSSAMSVIVGDEPNVAPIVSAGSDMVAVANASGQATFTVNALASDQDNDPVTLTWYENGILIGTGSSLNKTLSAGQHTITVTATDAYGASSSDTVVLSVQYSGSFFNQPINNDGSSIFKQGSTVPVKFTLTGASANANIVAYIFIAKVTNNIVGTEMEAVSTSQADSGNLFRSGGGGQWIFNLNTKNLTAGTYQIRADLGDGAIHTVIISLKP